MTKIDDVIRLNWYGQQTEYITVEEFNKDWSTFFAVPRNLMDQQFTINMIPDQNNHPTVVVGYLDVDASFRIVKKVPIKEMFRNAQFDEETFISTIISYFKDNPENVGLLMQGLNKHFELK